MASNNISQKVYIKTFGCQMNEYDSSRILSLLKSCGYKPASSYDCASLIILNTCSVRKKAEDKVYSELGRIKTLKKQRQNIIIGICGCVAQHEGKNLLVRFPYLDFVLGTKALARLPDLLEKVKQGNRLVDIRMDQAQDIYPHDCYSQESSRLTSFVTIMQGCNNYCSYCIVPYVRGPEWSRKPSEIKHEINNLVSLGIKEVTLLGQNVNSYGKTLVPRTSFPDLLYELNAINGLERIRFVTSHPKDLSPELIKCFGTIDRLCAHIHLPLQSGSNRILKIMKRCYTRESYIEKIDMLRETVPDVSITSDIIVGFPGESEIDYNETLSIIKRICFDDLFVFHYTDRPGTNASKYENKVPYETKLKRLTRINKMQNVISIRNNKKLVGKSFSVLFEGLSKKAENKIAGRTQANKTVNCIGPPELIGKTVLVKITKANIHSLNGELI